MKRRRWITRLGLPGVVAVALLLAGAAAAALMAAHTAKRPKATRVTVTEREYRLALSVTRFEPGTYTFVAVNRGKAAHSLEIAGPGVGKRRVPGTLRPGASRTLTVTLRKGVYSIWCPVDGHARLGMSLKVSVGGAPLATGGGTTTTAKKKSAWG